MTKQDVKNLDNKIAEADKTFAPLGKKAVITANLATFKQLFQAAGCLNQNLINRNYKNHRINISEKMADGEFSIYGSAQEVNENATKRLTKRIRH